MDRLFVYGTLLPDQSSWDMLEPWVVGAGEPDTAIGELYDTGLGWPAAVFGAGDALVHGQVFTLATATLAEALAVLDEFEGVHAGAYVRIEISTVNGRTAWAYHTADPGQAGPITSGDWRLHQP